VILIQTVDLPESCAGLGTGTDASDEEILELIGVGAVEVESAQCASIVDLVGTSDNRGGVSIVVGSVAEMGTARGCSDILRSREDETFEQCLELAFDTERSALIKVSSDNSTCSQVVTYIAEAGPVLPVDLPSTTVPSAQ
jgi:hypothetical protein